MRHQFALPMILLLLLSCMPVQAESWDNWFQVDVIVFKPLTTDMDGESWLEGELMYPEQVLSVTEPRPFNLSLLDQLAAEAELSVPETSRMASDEFAFQSQSRGSDNRRIVQVATGEAQAAAAPAEPGTDTADEVITAAAEPAFDIADLVIEETDSAGRLAFSNSEDNSSLSDVLRSLNRSSRFRVLDHQSWIQPIGSEPTAVMMQAGERYDDLYELEGTLAFSVSRYLHVETNLWYTLFEPRGIRRSGPAPATFGNLNEETLAAYADLVEVERQRGQYYPARRHAMVQSRRMRSGELHYIDHPLFGVIVRINRYDGPEGL